MGDPVKSESITHLPFSDGTGNERKPRILKFYDGKCINNPGVKGDFKPFRWDREAAVQRYMNDRAWRKEARAFYSTTSSTSCRNVSVRILKSGSKRTLRSHTSN